MKSILNLCLVCLCFCSEMFGQDTIRVNQPSDTSTVRWMRIAELSLDNPSFEDDTKCCTVPTGWIDCGQLGETPPDVQPGYFSAEQQAIDGDTYLGMVVRDNSTQETISQLLTNPLELEKVYEFSITLAKSSRYISFSRTTGREVNYGTPVVFQIYGGNKSCSKSELLAETGPISHTNWKEYTFRFSPKKSNYKYFIMKANYNPSALFPYNGNLLLDDCSSIYEVMKIK